MSAETKVDGRRVICRRPTDHREVKSKSDTYYIIQFLDAAPMALVNRRINEYQGYRPSLLYVALFGARQSHPLPRSKVTTPDTCSDIINIGLP